MKSPIISPNGYKPEEDESGLVATFVTLTILGLAIHELRYAGYLCAVLAIITACRRMRLRTPDFIYPFALLLCTGIVLLPFANERGAKDLFFIFAGVSVALVVRTTRTRPWLLLMALILCVSVATMLRTRGYAPQFEVDISSSKSSLEGSWAFVFGLIATWALTRRRWFLAFVATILTVITLKRIALLAILLCLVVTLMPERYRRLLLSPLPMVLGNIFALALILAYASGALDHWVIAFFGVSPNEFGQGRQTLLAEIAEQILREPLAYVFVGRGPGMAYDAIHPFEDLDASFSPNLHSDTLKILYEYGAIAFCSFYYLMYRTRNTGARVMFLYLNITFLTDNTLIYQFVLFFFCLLALDYERTHRTQRVTTTLGSVPR